MLLDLEQFRQMWALDPEIGIEQYRSALAVAESQVKRWVGAAAYDDASAAEPTSPERQADLQQACSLLAMARAIPFLSLRAMPGGIVARLRTPDDASIDDLTPDQVGVLRAGLMTEARALIDLWSDRPRTAGPAVGLIDPLNIARRADKALEAINPRKDSRLPLL